MAGQPLCPMIVRVGLHGPITCTRRCVRGADRCASHGGIERSTTPDEIQRRITQPRQRCTATKKNGEPCKRYAIAGGRVCPAHGGSTPQAKKAAKERLLEMVEPALAELNRIIRDKRVADGDKLRAIQMVLDRTGYNGKVTLEHEEPVWLQDVFMKGILVDAPDVDVVDAEVVEDDAPKPAVDLANEARQLAEHEAEMARQAWDTVPDAEVVPMPQTPAQIEEARLTYKRASRMNRSDPPGEWREKLSRARFGDGPRRTEAG